MPTLEAEFRIVELLDYDPLTGVFTWKRAPSLRQKRLVGRRAGNIDKINGYRRIGVNGLEYRCNRLATWWMTGEWPEHDVDHENGNRADDRWDNLRNGTRGQNKQNQRKANVNNSTGLLGVSRKGKKFKAVIGLNYKYTHLGTFDTPEKAHEKYLEAKRVMHPFCTI